MLLGLGRSGRRLEKNQNCRRTDRRWRRRCQGPARSPGRGGLFVELTGGIGMNRPREHSWSGSRTRPRPVKRRRSCNSLPTPRLSSVPPQRSTSFPGLLASSEDSRSRRRRLRPALGHWPSPHSKDLGRINDAETARARAEDTMARLSARLQEAERELDRTQARTVDAENKLADAEHRVPKRVRSRRKRP
jgi:uncharacterized coiled-coil protein SlyX